MELQQGEQGGFSAVLPWAESWLYLNGERTDEQIEEIGKESRRSVKRFQISGRGCQIEAFLPCGSQTNVALIKK